MMNRCSFCFSMSAVKHNRFEVRLNFGISVCRVFVSVFVFVFTEENPDLDGDGINEYVDAFADVTIGSLETVAVLAGTFHNVLRLDGKMEINVTMSSSGEVVVTKDTLTSWFAPHVGLIKYIETINVPIMGDVTVRTTVVTEELEEFRIMAPSLGN